MPGEGRHDLIALILAQQSMIDENTNQLITNRPVQ
jgi:hypothetical protein